MEREWRENGENGKTFKIERLQIVANDSSSVNRKIEFQLPEHHSNEFEII